MNPYLLRKPFSVDGKEFKELTVDLDEMSADDLIGVYDEHNARKSGNPAYSAQNLPLLFIARLNNLVLEDLRSKLKGRDYLAVIGVVDSFFTDTGSPTTSSGPAGETPSTTKTADQS